MGSSPDINYPAQPSYGEGMADAMKAQMQQLLGQGEYAQMYADAGFEGGNLGDIIAGVEGPIRQQTAQVDTDVLRQTLLGSQTKVVKDPKTGKYGIPSAEVVKSSGSSDSDDFSGRYQLLKIHDTIQTKGEMGNPNYGYFTEPKYQVIDTLTGGITATVGGDKYYTSVRGTTKDDGSFNYGDYKIKGNAGILKDVSAEFQKINNVAQESGDDAVAEQFNFTNPNTGEPLKEGEVVREGDGMIDLLGDRRNALDPTTGLESDRMAGFDAEGNFLGLAALAEDIQRGNLSRQREADLSDVERLSGRYSDVMDQFRPGTQQALTDASAVLEAQKDNLTGAGSITIPGTSTYGGDMDAGTMTAAQVADPLALSAPTSYDPSAGVTGGTFNAATSYTPSAGVTGGTFDAGTSYTAAQVADPMELTAATSYDPSASVTGDGYTATAGLQGGNIGADSLRAALLADAESALSQGLTAREQASISNAARARSGMMGRTFDQSGAIAEAQALVAENNNRSMQNRGFAGDTLGREADIQRDDLGRGLQASMQNQAALNRAAEFGASQGMQAQLANQAATNQALSQGLSAGLSQEALAAQQAQAKAMADATATNRASEFGIGAGLDQEARANQAALQASLANQSASNQALQFGVGAGMEQQAQANQAALQAQLANQQATNQASQFGVGAGMEQDALRAQLGQQTSLAQAQMDQQAAAFDADAAQRASQVNQAQTQQANQFGVGATMDAQRLNEQLKQAGTLGYIDAATRLAALEDQYALDPFAALLGRGGGGSLQAGQGVFGQAGYGLNSGPQYLNPESGLGYISQMAANEASMYGAQLSADATRDAGMMSMIGGIGGGLLGNTGLFGK